jgi:hypothetical protein
VKLRARNTTVDQSYLLGLNGFDSRAFDAPNGGNVTIRHSVIQKGSNSDNAEFTMVEGEITQANPVMVYLPSSFTFTDNWLILRQAGPNQFGKYRNMPPNWPNGPAPPLPVIQRNKFVNMTNRGEFSHSAPEIRFFQPGQRLGLARRKFRRFHDG